MLHFVVLAGICVARTDAEPSQAAGQVAFAGRVEVALVEVDLWVTDNQGMPVLDLRRDELRLFEDGREVELGLFVSPNGGLRASRTKPESGESPAAGERAVAAPLVAVFLDDAHLEPARRQRVMAELANWLDHELDRGVETLLVTFDQGLRVVVPRTRDRSKIVSALENGGLVASSALQRELAERDVIGLIRDQQRMAIEGSFSVPCSRTLLSYAESWADQVEMDARATLRALGGFAASLGSLPGKKLLLFVSDGLSARPGGAAIDYVRTLCDGSGAREGIEWAIDVTAGAQEGEALDAATLALAGTTRQLAGVTEAIVARANAHAVTVWTLGAKGLTVFGSEASESGRTRTMATPALQNAELEDVLFALATGTGGRAILRRNDMTEALEAIQDDFDSAFALGFSSPHAGDGKVHQIRLETTRPGVRLRYRRSWRDTPRDEELSARIEAAVLYGVDRSGLGLNLSELSRKTIETGERVVVRVTLGTGSITLLPSGDGKKRGSVRLAVAIGPREGAPGAVRSRLFAIELPATSDGASAEPPIVRDLELPLDTVPSTVVVAVRDELSGEWATERLELGARHN